jgi:hypothetical protein
MVAVSFTDRHAPARAPAGPEIPSGVRAVLIGWFERHDVSAAEIRDAFFQLHAYGRLADISEDITERWGDDEAEDFLQAIAREKVSPPAQRAYVPVSALFEHLPPSLFLDALECGIEVLNTKPYSIDDFVYDTYQSEAVAEINRLFEKRGIHYRFTDEGKAEWHGDPEAHKELVAPALAALDDQRFAAAAQQFRHALTALRRGDDLGAKDAARDATGAVETAMKSLLDEHGIDRPDVETASNLWKALRDAGIVAEKTREPISAAAQLGNQYGRHGSDPQPKPAPTGIPTLIVNSAAAALIYLVGLLPEP